MEIEIYNVIAVFPYGGTAKRTSRKPPQTIEQAVDRMLRDLAGYVANDTDALEVQRRFSLARSGKSTSTN